MGRILVNNIDIAEYGIKVINEYAISLLNPPEKKDLTTIDWYEGQFDVDLDEGIKFKEERQITLECYQTNFTRNFQTFLSVLMAQPYNLFTFEQFGLNLRLKLLKIENNNVFYGFDNQQFKITLLQDDFNNTFIDNHIPQNYYDDACSIEGINVNDYGFVLLQGSLDAFFKRTIRDRLKGATYALTTKPIECELSFGCTTLDIDTFKTNFNSFIALVTTAGSKSVELNYKNTWYKLQCFYDNIAIKTFLLNENKVWVEFTFKIIVTDIASDDVLSVFRTLSHEKLTNMDEDFTLENNRPFSVYLIPKDSSNESLIEILDVVLIKDAESETFPFNIQSFNPCNIAILPATERNKEVFVNYEIYILS